VVLTDVILSGVEGWEFVGQNPCGFDKRADGEGRLSKRLKRGAIGMGAPQLAVGS
jgi:hypothetical protein